MTPPPISVIIPTLDESALLGATAQSARAPGCETIVVDGGSVDDTVAVARRSGARVLQAPRGRAAQMNAGAAAARGELLLFLHADTRLPAGYADAVTATLARPAVVAGAFMLGIEPLTPTLRVIQRVANWRARVLHRPYGDQALFLRAARFREVGGFQALPMMEDLQLVRRLSRLGRIDIAPLRVTTSARRWQSGGAWRTTFVNQAAVLGFLAGIDPSRLARWTGRRRR